MHNLNYHEWTTIAVTPITGWVNRFRVRDSSNIDTSECPAILLQEKWEQNDEGVFRRVTRAVFAVPMYSGELVEVTEASDYIGTIPASEVSPWS